jgi:hypothetical protein
MRPYPEEVLQGIQAVVMTHALPEAQTDYTRAELSFSLLLLGIVAGRLDSAVEALVNECQKMRRLLVEARDALSRCDDPEAQALAASLAGVETPETASLKLSEQRKEYERLRGELGRLAPVVEPSIANEALAPLQAMRQQLIRYLHDEAAARVVPILGNA